MPNIKISGITNTEDAKWAAILGVEYVSISMEYGDDKKISLDRAVEIRNLLPSYTKFVADFGGIPDLDEKLIRKLNPGYMQVKRKRLEKDEPLIDYRDNIDINESGLDNDKPDEVLKTADQTKSSESVEAQSVRTEEFDDDILQEKLISFEPLVIYETNYNDDENIGNLDFKCLQLNIIEPVNNDCLYEIKEKYNMDNTIIEGDWPLQEIKRACSILQPYVWSIKGALEKSPRKIDYKVMKEYIREISLW